MMFSKDEETHTSSLEQDIESTIVEDSVEPENVYIIEFIEEQAREGGI